MASVSGSLIWNVVPRAGSVWTVTEPPSVSMLRRTTARPTPPPPTRLNPPRRGGGRGGGRPHINQERKRLKLRHLRHPYGGFFLEKKKNLASDHRRQPVAFN